MIKVSNINIALQKIKELFAEQVVSGVQSKEVGKDVLCCGQFIGNDAKDIPQRGIHGTAAALRVMADDSYATSRNEIEQIIKYLEDRNEIEISLKDKGIGSERMQRDENNVIKLGEVLYALSFVKTGQGETEKLKTKIHSKLLKALKEGKGWNYYLDSPESSPELLPTAFAYYGLTQNGYNEDFDNVLKYLIKEISNYNKPEKIDSPSLFSIIIFTLYVLVFSTGKLEKEILDDLKKVLNSVLNSPYMIIRFDEEQHLEYRFGTNHNYVRIPWQLYILAICAKIKPRELAKKDMQSRFNSALKQSSLDDGFKYSNSGPYLSARTNGILFDCMKLLKDSYKSDFRNNLFGFWDEIVHFFDKRWIINIRKILLIIFFVTIIFLWVFQEGDGVIGEFFKQNPKFTKFLDLATEILGPFLLGLYFIGKKK